jgi:hypothetical protein
MRSGTSGTACQLARRSSRVAEGMRLMLDKPMLTPILQCDALTRGLADPEARILVEWLVDQAERMPEKSYSAAQKQVQRLCRRGRAISRFVFLWCYEQRRGAATQLAASERFHWPLPAAAVDPCELMQSILDWESNHRLAA